MSTDPTVAGSTTAILHARLQSHLDDMNAAFHRHANHELARDHASAAQAIAAALAVLPDKPGRVWTRPTGNSPATAAFALWLADQQDREDPVGDVAREFIEGARRGLHDEHYATASEVRHAWEALDASPSRLDTLDRAVAEWEAGR